MPLSARPVNAGRRPYSMHVWGTEKTGKSRLALTGPKPCYVNLDRPEDQLLESLGLEGILRDRIQAPPGEITYDVASILLRQVENDIDQAIKLGASGALQSLVLDGVSLYVDIVTIVTLHESKNPNTTYRYAGRNAYIKTMLNRLNSCGLNVFLLSKAKPLWVGNQRVAGEYVPDCHEDIPFLVDVNVQTRTEPEAPFGLKFYAKIGMNAFRPDLVGMNVLNPTHEILTSLLFTPQTKEKAEEKADAS